MELEIYFDPYDIKSVNKLCDIADEVEMPYTGVDNDGNNIMIEPTSDFVLYTVFRKDMTETNYIYRDGRIETVYKS